MKVMKAWCVALGLAGLGVAPAGAQTLPSEPISVSGGRMTISGDVSATVGSDDPGFFDYTDYEHSALRLLRADVSAAVNGGDHFTLLGELRTENLDSMQAYALYVRIKPWTRRAIDIEVGRIPPVFGAFARRTYGSDNPLIGYPLAYQYLTSLRPDSLPASADELLRKRGLGWLTRYTVGNASLDKGVALVSAFRWDTGVQVHATAGVVNASVAVTAGTLSNPLFHDDNNGRQVAGRVELRPVGALSGLIAGTSVARGPFVSASAVRAALGDDSRAGDFTQTAWGGDLEYSRGYYLLRVETIVSDWQLPTVRTPALDRPLRAVSTSLEGRYKIRPGLFAAGRVDHLGFSDVAGTLVMEPWDAPVTRVEVGGGYSIQRNLQLKLSYQYNHRDGGPLEQLAHLKAAQLVFWF
ncbi:MAG: hypothetical protein HY048_19450 [Acidobacteria bacterium]|nr:hypothetical protein [Acidobacteriota bacterium]